MWILFFIGVGVMMVVLVSVMAYVAMHQPEEGAGEEKVIAQVPSSDATQAEKPGLTEEREKEVGATT